MVPKRMAIWRLPLPGIVVTVLMLCAMQAGAEVLDLAPSGSETAADAASLSKQADEFNSAGRYGEAEPLYRRALAIRERALGPDHPDTAKSLNDVANVLEETGRYGEAESLYRRALAIREQALGPDHLDTAQSLDDLATLLYQAGRYGEAEPIFRRVLAIREKALGPDHPDTATSLGNLGGLLDTTGRYGEAEPLYRRALAIREKVLGPDDPYTALSFSTLGHVLATTGRYAEAEPLYRRALAIREKTLGPDHPVTVASLNNLAALLWLTGRYGETEPLLRQVLVVREKALGPDHPDTATSLSNLATLLDTTGRYGEAEPLFRRALAIREKALGPDHPETAQSLHNLATLLYQTGRYGEAEPLYRRALAIREKALGPDHPDTALNLNNLANLLSHTGRYDEADPLLRRALAITEKALGPDHTETARSVAFLANLLYFTGRYGEAEPLYRRALAINEKALGPDHRDTAASLINLANVLYKTGRYGEAEPLYRQALAINEKALGPDHPDTAESLNDLADLLNTTGRFGEAEPLYLRALSISDHAGQPLLASQVTSSLMRFYQKRDASAQPAIAVYYGKLAVNSLQSLRQNLRALDSGAQRAFLHSIEDVYGDLETLLIDAGRLAEAQQVRAMQKEQEYYDFIRRDAPEDPRTTTASLTSFEAESFGRQKKAGDVLFQIAQEIAPLDKRVRDGQTLSADEQAHRHALREQLDRADENFLQVTAQIQAGFEELGASPQRLEEERRHLEQTLAGVATDLGKNVAILQTVSFRPDRLTILLTIGEVRKAYSTPITTAELNALVSHAATALQNPNDDPRADLSRLYSLLIQPLAADLNAAHVSLLMFSLDGVLRYLPMSALYDAQSKHYLVEDYAVSLFNEEAHLSIKDAPAEHWRVGALGVTQEHPPFVALKAVAGELSAIVAETEHSSGVLPGRINLDQQFTESTLVDDAHDYPVVHIASHFAFRPGNESESFLLLGDGSHLTLDKFRSEIKLSRVDLLTLSACQTAVGSGGQGTEVEGLAVVAQTQGAKSILATLWSVDDSSTGLLMSSFYRSRERQQLSKAEALRRAQLELLGGAPSLRIAPHATKEEPSA